MAYEVFENRRKGTLPTGDLAISIGIYSITLNAAAYSKFCHFDTVGLVLDRDNSRAGIVPPSSTSFPRGFKLMKNARNKTCRVLGCREFLRVTKMDELRASRGLVVECQFEETEHRLSWKITATEKT